jgi:DNA modification methylase
LESTSIWSFPERGNWATHSGKYRGNWSPYVPRNIILRYSNIGDWVLDQFLGSGTTLVEAKLLNRNAIGIDINQEALHQSEQALNFQCSHNSKIFIRQGNAIKLDFLKSESIDLICTHPPYADIISYSKDIIGDLSLLDYKDFLESVQLVALESYRVLKKNKYCAIMIGDIRKKGKLIPLGMEIQRIFMKNGFALKDIAIKEQHNCRSTGYWENKPRNFLMLAHEYIFIFQK